MKKSWFAASAALVSASLVCSSSSLAANGDTAALATAASSIARAQPFFTLLPESGGTLVGVFAHAPVVVRRDGFAIGESGESGARTSLAFVVRMIGAAGARFDGTPIGVDPIATRFHRFHGIDAATYARSAPTFAAARIAGADGGVTLDLRATARGLEYDLSLGGNVDANDVVIDLEGATDVAIASDGSLRIETAAGVMTQQPPATFARDARGDARGDRRALASRCVRLGPTRIGFAVDGRGAGESICIDPVVAFGTYIGTSVFDEIRDVASDSAGNVYVTGWTSAASFPTTVGAYDTVYNGNREAFVAMFGPNCATLEWATFLGGIGNDEGLALTLGSNGLTVTGRTSSTNFPTTAGAFATTNGGGDDAFVARFTTSGDTLLASTYLGGIAEDVPAGIAVDDTAVTWVAGTTASSNFPTTPGVVSNTLRGAHDAFVARLDAGLTALVYSTFVGGLGDDSAFGLTAQRLGPLTIAGFVAGSTTSTDFPVTGGAFDTTPGGATDGFALRITSDGTALAYATFVGDAQFDAATAIAVDPFGAATVVGETWSTTFPTTGGAAQTVFGGGFGDAFVTKLDAAGASVAYSTFLGGAGDDAATGVALDFAFAAHVAARAGPGFPVPGFFFGGSSDAAFARLSVGGNTVADGAYVGGGNADEPAAIFVDCVGRTIVAGSTFSGDVAAVGVSGFDPGFNGLVDGFVAAFQKGTITCGSAPSATSYGAGKPGTFGVPTLTAPVLPNVPTPAFTLSLQNGFPGALPVLFLGFSPINVAFDGGALLVNPAFVLPLVPYPGSGTINLTFPFCDVAAYCGATAYMQVMFADPGGTGFYMTAQTAGLTITLGS